MLSANRDIYKPISKPESLYMATYEGSLFRCCIQLSGFLFGRNEMGKFQRWDQKKYTPVFYTYLIIIKEGNTPIYVGKGHNDRVLYSNEKYKRKLKKETIYKFAFSGLNEQKALKFERDLIFIIGRKDKGEGPLLNKTDGGYGLCGFEHSEKTKRKISKSHMGITPSEETIKKLRESHKGQISHMKGKHHSKEARRKLSEAHKGQIPWNTGKKWSKENRLKMSLAHKGKTPWMKGKKHSLEARKKMSLSHKGQVPWNKGKKL